MIHRSLVPRFVSGIANELPSGDRIGGYSGSPPESVSRRFGLTPRKDRSPEKPGAFVELCARHLVNYVQPDVSHAGGILELKKIGAIAEAHRFPARSCDYAGGHHPGIPVPMGALDPGAVQRRSVENKGGLRRAA
jgi:Enolase C-terminal domain-like